MAPFPSSLAAAPQVTSSTWTPASLQSSWRLQGNSWPPWCLQVFTRGRSSLAGLWDCSACVRGGNARAGLVVGNGLCWDGLCPFPMSCPWLRQLQAALAQGCGPNPSLLFQRHQVPVPERVCLQWLVPSSAALQQLLEQRGTEEGARGS